MRASCPNCECAVWVAEEELMIRPVEIKCPSCSHAFLVRYAACLVNRKENHEKPDTKGPLNPLPSAGLADLETTHRSLGSQLIEDIPSAKIEKEHALTESKGRNGVQSQQYVKQRTGVSAIRAQSGYLAKGEDTASLAHQPGWTEPLKEKEGAGRENRFAFHAWVVLASVSTLAMLVMLYMTFVRYDLVDGGIWWLNAGDKPATDLVSAETWLNSETFSKDSDNADEIYVKSLEAAEQAMRGKRYSRAALEFNRALSVRPGSIEALRGLAKAYQGLGDFERAALVEIPDAQ